MALSRTIGEQVGTARGIVPFGASASKEGVLTFAVGETRAPAPELAVAPSTPQLAEPTTPTEPEIDPLEPPEMAPPPKVGDEGEREQATPDPKVPVPVNVLLEGKTRDATAPTAWARAATPLDAAGDPLTPGGWWPAGAAPSSPDAPPSTPSAYAGEAAAGGAAALLITRASEGGAPRTAEFLVRTASGRFRALPAPPASLLAPASRVADPAVKTNEPITPFAVFDVAGPPSQPGSSTPDSTPASTSDVGQAYGRTGLLLMPTGGDGVLVWDGEAWSEEPFLAPGGTTPATTPITPVALAATADGDGVVLVDHGTAREQKVTLYRRAPKSAGWRPMTLHAPLLSNPLPDGVSKVDLVEPRHDPLTIAPGHWWIDLAVTAGRATYATTIHLTPGPPPGAQASDGGGNPPPTNTSPSTPAPTDPTSPSTPAATDPADTTPAPTTTPTTPTSPWEVTATHTWCEATDKIGPMKLGLPSGSCDEPFPAKFPFTRGYRSFAFAGSGVLPDGTAPTTPSATSPWGGRVITSPVIDPAREEPTERDASSEGGYLRLDGSEFSFRGGLGETDRADQHTEMAAFLSDRLGWIGSPRVIGHVTTAPDPGTGAAIGTSPVVYDMAIDVALPPSTPDAADGGGGVGLLTSSNVRRVYGDGRVQEYADGLQAVLNDNRVPRAVAWPIPETVVVVGTGGLFATLDAPRPRLFLGDETYREPENAPSAKGLDLTDVAFRDISGATSDEQRVDEFEGWAVGRSGAAMRVRGLLTGAKAAPLKYRLPEPTPVTLKPPLDKADLRQVVYAGPRAYVASSRGLLAAIDSGTEEDPKPTLAVEQALNALMLADGRTEDVRSVAALPDGTIVVDARYAKAGPNAPWQRLPSPAEGDVVAMGISRPPGSAAGIAGLQIQASIADSPRPRTGEPPLRRGGGVVSTTPLEQPVLAIDGRLTELTPDGWIDRVRTPLDVGGVSSDVPVPAVPTQAIASHPVQGGWAASAVGSGVPFDLFLDEGESAIQSARGGVAPLTPRAPEPAAVAMARVGASARADGGRRAQASTPLPAPTSPTTPSTTPPTTPQFEPAGPGAAPIRILIGGHPACLEICTGRADQRIAPTENLRQALAAAARMREAGGPAAPRAMVIGGGRTTRDGWLFDRAAAQDYVDLLRSEPTGPPVLPAIGTGDAWLEDSKATFTHDVIGALQPKAADGIFPVTLRPPKDTAGYAFDVPGPEGGAARVIVADTTDTPGDDADGNPQGTPSDWTNGLHGAWLSAVLQDAQDKGLPTVVIGAARIDRGEGDAAKTQFLLDRGVEAYVSTDGVDDVYSLASGARQRRTTVTSGDRELLLVHTSGLSHALLGPTFTRNLDEIDDEDWFSGEMSDLSGSAMVELSIPPEQESRRRVVPRAVPVFREFFQPEIRLSAVGEAGITYLQTATDSDNGVRYLDSLAKDPKPVPSWGSGLGDATPFPCRLWFGPEQCGAQIDSVGSFQVADPSIAVFVRARVDRNDPEGLPEIVSDAKGNPVPDSGSPVVCALKIGSTTATATVAGRTVTMPIHVETRPRPRPGQKRTAKCSFAWEDDSSPVSTPPSAKSPVPAPGRPIAPPLPTPQPPVKPTPPTKPAVDVPAAKPPVAPLFAVPLFAMEPPVGPTVAPNPKPIQTPATPSPPTGVQSHSWAQVASPATQFQIATAMQERRREQLARESADHFATAYRPEPSNPLLPAVAGGTLVALLVGTAGHVAGRRRALSRAAQRNWLQ